MNFIQMMLIFCCTTLLHGQLFASDTDLKDVILEKQQQNSYQDLTSPNPSLNITFKDGRTVDLNYYPTYDEADVNSSAFDDAEQAKFRDKSNLSHSIVIPVTKLQNKSYFIGLGVTAVVIAFDEQIMEFVQNHRSEATDRLAELGDHLGSDYLPPLVVGSYAVGFIFHNKTLREAAIESVESALVGQLIVEVAKSLTHRARPNRDRGAYAFDGPDWQSDNTSFVSGHSAGAWSVATVFAKKYKHSKIVPIIAYSLATLVSISRVNDNKHWMSDVILGGMVGYSVGSAVVDFNERHRRVKLGFSVKKDFVGLTLKFRLGRHRR
jgi:hypothetical protein